MIWFLRALPINCQALGGALAYLYTISTVSPSSDSGLLEYTVSDTNNVQNCSKKLRSVKPRLCLTEARTADNQWRHKSKTKYALAVHKNLGVGVKAISSLDVHSPCMEGKAAKAWSLAGFREIEKDGGGSSAPVKWPPLLHPCLPKIYHGSHASVSVTKTMFWYQWPRPC